MAGMSPPTLLGWKDEVLAASFEGDPRAAIRTPDNSAVVFEGGEAFTLGRPASKAAKEAVAEDGVIRAPMPGRIVQVAVKAGETVDRGRTIAILEAMKMEHALVAPFDAVVAEAPRRAGDQVSEGDVLVKLAPRG
jgi:acetyl/propionyl-CoA carboxylase alpha subunit